MVHNRNKLLTLLIGNLVNAVVHRVLEEATTEEILRKRYDKESLVSYEVAKRYREQINPLQRCLSPEDAGQIRKEVIRRAYQELQTRISKGYQDVDITLIEPVLQKLLKELRVEEE